MDYITVALPKGKLFQRSVELLYKVGYSADNVTEDSRKLVISNEDSKVRFIITKTVDLPTYVEYGAADIGIIGKDVLLEERKDVYELLDLKYGRCRLMLAVPEQMQRPRLTDYAHLRVATKYPNCAQEYFRSLGIQTEIIKLNGSIELGPMVGLSELIVDIVETGRTLKENKLVEVDSIYTATARLIANRVSFKLKFDRLDKLVRDLRKVLDEEEEQCK
ncbi:ATP phosphoribosyltransferase [Phascolarctobacterium faecium DSM 14760]|uniref:ATP phosphoribosyltransferase n=1 Tax=Phascolarctobacterium faecium TaxID=33025 RepID=UPI000DC48F4D|nr:ATP phosphoribosyltransferase [Phascolarctobacterium faecium]RAS53179.1 ATP phosphoribosyltransferase [Phascolarctobacterium faecium DSM 14760]